MRSYTIYVTLRLIYVYMKIFAGYKNFTKPDYLCIAENWWNKFSMWYRSQYPLCNHYTGHIISVIKLSPIRAGGKIGENFSPGENF